MRSQTLNASEMRFINKSRVLSQLRTHPISRADLARKTGLTRAAISVIVDDLLLEGFLIEGTSQSVGVGRKSISLELNRDAYYTLGLNITRKDYSVGLVDFAGNIHENSCKPLDPSISFLTTLKAIDREIQRLKSRITLAGKYLGMGITAPGPLDPRRGLIMTPPNFGSWINVPIIDFFSKRDYGDLVLENNANALALAEKTFGLKDEYTSFLELTVDTGIGAGLIHKGELSKGSCGFGNEFGHISLNIDGPLCGCGNKGCIELYASISNLVAAARAKNPELSSWELIVANAKKGHAAAIAVLDREAEYISCLIVNAVNILDVPAVVLTGNIIDAPNDFKIRIEKNVNDRIISRKANHVVILDSKIANRPAILSSANLVLEQFLVEKRN